MVPLAQIKVSDTSTAESSSELEEMASPQANKETRVPKLTPVCEDVRVSLYEIEITVCIQITLLNCLTLLSD